MRKMLAIGLISLAGCAPEALKMNPMPSEKPSPAIVNQVIGTSVQRRPIVSYTIDGDAAKTVLVLGAIHGDEVASAAVVQGLLDLLQQQPEAAQKQRIVIIPVANPDGFANGTRTNAHHVDLNRDFPAANFKAGPRMAQALAEPESAALAELIRSLKPRLIISVHAIVGRRQCNNYDGPGQPIAEAMAKHNGFPVTGDIGYPVPGSLGSWAGKDLQIAMVTLELPRTMSGAEGWRINREALIDALKLNALLNITQCY